MKLKSLTEVVRLKFIFILLFMVVFQPVYGYEDTSMEPPEDDSWPQFNHNVEHQGLSLSSAPQTNQTAWVVEGLNAQAGSSVVVADGKVFVNCVNNLTCLDQFTGEVLWKTPFDHNADVCCSWFSPAYNQNKVFLSGMNIVCLNAEDGQEIWTFDPPSGRGAVDGGPAIVDGQILVSDWDGHHYYCLNESTGEELWNFSVTGSAQSTPAVFEDKVVFGSWEWGLGGVIYCVDLNDGSEMWNLTTKNSPCGSASILNGVIYMTTYNFGGDGDLFALSLQDGSVLWRKTIQPTDSTPTLADGKVYVCGGCDGFSDLQTSCFDALSGDLIWSTDPKERIGDWRCSMAYADGLLFSGVPDFTDFGGICALNATNGELVWSYPEGGSSPAIANGMLFTTGKGNVYAFGNVNFAVEEE